MVHVDAVSSSWIESVEYDDVDRSLTLTFLVGGNYTYRDVDPMIWRAMMLPGMSKGKFVNVVLKPMDM